MSYDNSGYGGYAPAGAGCGALPWMLLVIAVCALGIISAGGGDGSAGRTTTNTTSTVNRTNVEAFSRNQANLFSDVQNCYGDGSCPSYVVTTTTTAVGGDRSTLNVTTGGGLPTCLDPTTGAYTSSACNGTYAGGQP